MKTILGLQQKRGGPGVAGGAAAEVGTGQQRPQKRTEQTALLLRADKTVAALQRPLPEGGERGGLVTLLSDRLTRVWQKYDALMLRAEQVSG